MANVRSGNSFYVDSTGVLSSLGVKVFYIVLTANGGSPTIELSDTASGSKKIVLKLHSGQASEVFDFSRNPLFFGGGMEVTSINHAVVTIVYNERGG